MNKSLILLIVAVIVLVGIGIAGFYFWQNQPELSTKNFGLPQVKSPFSAGQSPEAGVPPAAGPQTMTYEGTLPCADCEGLRTVLTLNSEQDDSNELGLRRTYTLKETYIGKQTSPAESEGGWELVSHPPATSSAKTYIVLHPQGETTTKTYWLESIETITSVNNDFSAISAPFNLSLTLKK